MEKDQAILKIKNTFMCKFDLLSPIITLNLDKMEELQKEVELMKQQQSEKSSSYKKIKHEYSKLKGKSKEDEALINKFFKKFENDLAFARNWVLSFERDLSNITNLDERNMDQQLDEYLNNSLSYAQNMKAFIAQVEKSMSAFKRNNSD